MLWPATMKFGSERSFAFASRLAVVPKRAAIDDSVSPERTRCRTAGVRTLRCWPATMRFASARPFALTRAATVVR
jgi:hypothetical protein